jgi:hypothetical protein
LPVRALKYVSMDGVAVPSRTLAL